MKNKDRKDELKNVGSLPYEVLRLGVYCNAKCVFCNIPMEKAEYPELTFDEIKLRLKEMKNNSEGREVAVSLSGGEPTIYKHLGEVITYAKKIGIRDMDLQTNAFRFKDLDYAKKMVDAGLEKVFVSFHSHKKKVHDVLMGKEGAFEDCIAGMKNLDKLGVKICINIVVTFLNFRELKKTIEFINGDLPKIVNISLSVVQPYGRMRKNIRLLPRYAVIDKYIKEALELCKKYNIDIYNPYCGLPMCIGGWYKYPDKNSEYSVSKCKKITKDKNKLKGPRCSECKYYNCCGGVWDSYARLYGFNELKPIK